jgi:hypothetical protein
MCNIQVFKFTRCSLVIFGLNQISRHMIPMIVYFADVQDNAREKGKHPQKSRKLHHLMESKLKICGWLAAYMKDFCLVTNSSLTQ